MTDCDGTRMDDCDELIETLHGEAREQIELAMMADAVPVAEMHIDLAAFAEERAHAVEEFCADTV